MDRKNGAEKRAGRKTGQAEKRVRQKNGSGRKTGQNDL
jgi:hypothetical protein